MYLSVSHCMCARYTLHDERLAGAAKGDRYRYVLLVSRVRVVPAKTADTERASGKTKTLTHRRPGSLSHSLSFVLDSRPFRRKGPRRNLGVRELTLVGRRRDDGRGLHFHSHGPFFKYRCSLSLSLFTTGQEKKSFFSAH